MLILTVLTLIGSAWADETMTVSDGFCTALIENQQCIRNRRDLDVSVIDENTASDLFRAFKSDPTYAWKYRNDGCYARATKMAREAEKRGVSFAKVYAEGRLRVLPPGPINPQEQRWAWHVAPVVYVKSFKDGKPTVELKVIDPAIFSGPVALSDWKEQIRSADDLNHQISNAKSVAAVTNAENKLSYRAKSDPGMDKFFRPEVREVYFGSRYQYMSRSQDQDAVTKWNPEELKSADQVLKIYRLYELKINNQFMSDVYVSPVIPSGTRGAK